MNTIAALTQMKKESDVLLNEKLSQVDNLEKMMYELVLEKRKNLLVSQALRIRKAIHQSTMSLSEALDLIRETFLGSGFVLMHEIGLLLESHLDTIDGELEDIRNLSIFDILTISRVLQCKPSDLYNPRGDSLLYTADEFNVINFDLSDILNDRGLSEESRDMMISDSYSTFFNEKIFERVKITDKFIDAILEATSLVKHGKCSVVLVHLLSKMFNKVENDSLRYKIFIILMYAKDTHYYNNPEVFGFEMRYVFDGSIQFSDIERGLKYITMNTIVGTVIKRLVDQNCVDDDLADEINILYPLDDYYYYDDVDVILSPSINNQEKENAK